MFETKFSGHKKRLGKALPLNVLPWLWARGVLVNGLSKSRGIVAFLTQNITNFLFYQGHQNSGRSGGTVEKFMAMETYF